ncbi:hypothetical protein N9J72_02235 [Candidatus Gracilibacteria bacterium]|nr:hypothetical protein [Candidatus Gracilibacteria bacterium]
MGTKFVIAGIVFVSVFLIFFIVQAKENSQDLEIYKNHAESEYTHEYYTDEEPASKAAGIYVDQSDHYGTLEEEDHSEHDDDHSGHDHD